MKRLFAGLCVLALVSAISPLAPVQAQSTAEDKRPFAYDVAKEITLSGTVLSALDKPAKGMIMGSHLLLATSSGSVDASLARLVLEGKHAVSIAAGQQVEVTGVMKTIKDKQVFLARTMKVGAEVYTIRNEHGYPVSQQSRERASRKSAGEGL